MPKPDRQVIVSGEQQSAIDELPFARLIIRFVRHRLAQSGSTEPAVDTPDTTKGDSC